MKLLILVTLLSMCSLTGASADLIYSDGSINESSDRTPIANWPQTFTVPKFDPSLGTLDGMIFEMWSGFWSRANWTSASDYTQPVLYSNQITFMASVEDGDFASVFTSYWDTCLASDKRLSIETYNHSTSNFYRPDDQQILDWFTGTGDKVVTVTPSETPSITAYTTLEGVTYQTEVYTDYWYVEYDYTPVPEPSSLAAFAAFAGTGLMMTRRRRS